MAKKIIIKFATNWNGKLLNDYFTTIRRNKLDVKEGDIAGVRVSDTGAEFDVRVVREIKTRLSKITDLVAYLDFGRSRAEFIDYLQRAYKEDLNKGYLYLYLLHNESKTLIPF